MPKLHRLWSEFTDVHAARACGPDTVAEVRDSTLVIMHVNIACAARYIQCIVDGTECLQCSFKVLPGSLSGIAPLELELFDDLSQPHQSPSRVDSTEPYSTHLAKDIDAIELERLPDLGRIRPQYIVVHQRTIRVDPLPTRGTCCGRTVDV